MKKLKFEICAESLESVKNAKIAGADRVELCSSLIEGGITPGWGLIEASAQLGSIEVHVMIRPRGGDFVYSEDEFSVMTKDIEMLKKFQFDNAGVVAGVLTKTNEIDVLRMKKLIELTKPLPFTCHRAFDRCKDPLVALEQLIELGVGRVLTSGAKQTAFEGRELIAKLIQQANGRIEIMPGSGINANNIQVILSDTKATNFHFTAKKSRNSVAEPMPTNVSFNKLTPEKYQEEVHYSDVGTIKEIMNKAKEMI